MKKILFILSTALLTLTACHDDASLYGDGANTVGGNELRVVVPTSRANDDGKAIYFTTEEECQINTLRIIAFDEDDTKVFNEAVANIPSASDLNNHNGENDNTYVPQQSIVTENKVKPGKYKVYVVANYNDHDATKDTYTEKKELAEVTNIQDLEALLLEYSATAMPTAGNLPMVYVPKDESGNDKLVTVTATEGGTVYADLQFTCAKVRYNLIFDKSSDTGDQTTKTNFGTNFLGITSVDGKQFSPIAPLIWDGKFKRTYTDTQKPFDIEDYTEGEGTYYSTWTYDANKTGSNQLMVDDVSTKLTSTSTADKWLYQGTCYVPERFVTSDAYQSYLQFNGQIYDSNGAETTTTNHYTMPIGHNDSDKDSHTYLPRSTFYELVGNIETIGSAKLKTTVNFAPWKNVAIAADFSHTTLWVSTASVSVKAGSASYLDYTSNATTVTMGWDKNITDDKGNAITIPSDITEDLIVQVKQDAEAGRIFFQINPNIPISKFGDGDNQLPATGTTKIYLQANNLRKYIEVTYTVKPIFEVSPSNIVITYGLNNNAQNIEFNTNLGGVTLPGTLFTSGNSTITLAYNEGYTNTSATGTVKITATTDPVTTTYFTLNFTPNTTESSYKDNKDYTRSVYVTVKPAFGPYRIHMRAINDRQYCAPGITSDATEYAGTLKEGGSSNWNDGWKESDWTNQAEPDYHKIYVYFQKGETDNNEIPEESVVRYAGKFPGTSMTGNTSNPGWYDYTMPYETKASGVNFVDQMVKPGQTLLIFSNNVNADTGGNTLHRFTHHMEPGITLFNYEDREGWYVYDPTCDPCYKIYDEKPTIEDIHYTVYTTWEIKRWDRAYGVRAVTYTENGVTKTNATGGTYHMYANTGNETFKSEQVSGTSWWKTTITLKAVKGEYAKAIILRGDTKGDASGTEMFDGNSYKDNTGYYGSDNKWYEGKPSGVN